MGQSTSNFYQSDRSSFSIQSIDFNIQESSTNSSQSATFLSISNDSNDHHQSNHMIKYHQSNSSSSSSSTHHQPIIISFIPDPDHQQLNQTIQSAHQSSLLNIPLPIHHHHHSLNLNFRLQLNNSLTSSSSSTIQSSSIAFIITDSSDSLHNLLLTKSSINHHQSNIINLPYSHQSTTTNQNQIINFNWTFSPPSNSQRTSGYRTHFAFVAFDHTSNQSATILTSFSLFFQQIIPSTFTFTSSQPSSILTNSIHSNQSNQSTPIQNHSNHPISIQNHSNQNHSNQFQSSSVTLTSNNLLSTSNHRHISQISKSSTSPCNLNSSAFPSSTPTEPFTLPTPDTAFEDGPLFRAKLTGLERRSANLKRGLKDIIKLLETYHETLNSLTECDRKLEEAFAQLDDISPAAYRPLKESYLQNARHLFHGLHSERLDKLQTTALQPLRKIFNRLKEADHHKKAFEHESKSYYEYITKYLAIRTGTAADATSKEAKAAERFDQMKTKFAFARIDYHHTLYDLAIFQETEVLQILTDYQINQHELHCLGTDLAQRLAPLGTSLHQLKSDLVANRIAIDAQKDSLAEHRRWWVTKLGAMSQQNPFPDVVSNSSYQSFNLIDSARLSIDYIISPPANSRPSNVSQTPVMKSATTSNITSMAPPSSPASAHTPIQPRSHDLAERLKGFAHTLAGITFQRDSSGSSHSTSHTEPAPFIEGRSSVQISTETRQARTSLPGSPVLSSTPLGLGSSPRSSSVDLPSRDKILNRDQLGISHPPLRSSNLNIPSGPSGNRSSVSLTPSPENEIPAEDQIEELITQTPSEARKKEGFLFSSTKLLSQQQLSSSNVNTTDTSSSKSWKKLWCVLAAGQLSEFSNWQEKAQLEINRPPINLRFATVREARNPERRFCFEVITPQTKRTYQATMDQEMKDWIRAISASIESLLNGTSSVRNFDFSKLKNHSSECIRGLIEESSWNPSRDSISSEFERPTARMRMNSSELVRVQSHQPVGFRRGLATKLIRKTSKLQPSHSHSHSSPISSNGLQKNRFTSSSKRPKSGLGSGGIGSSSTNRLGLGKNEQTENCRTAHHHESNSEGLSNARSNLEELTPELNNTSIPLNQSSSSSSSEKDKVLKNAERLNMLSMIEGNEKCGECGKKPARWASYSIGIFLCIRCSGLHRGLGTHLSKVRSLDLDDWSDEQIKNMELIGNEKAKLVWEARLPAGYKVTDQNIGEFIKEKYGNEKYKALPLDKEKEKEKEKDKVEEIKCDEKKLKELISIGIGSGSFIFEEKLIDKSPKNQS